MNKKYLILMVMSLALCSFGCLPRDKTIRAEYPQCGYSGSASPTPTTTSKTYHRFIAENFPKAESIPFHTIENAIHTRGRSRADSVVEIVIIDAVADIELAQEAVSQAAYDCLKEIDYSEAMALLVKREFYTSIWRGFKITEILKRDDELIILANKGAPTGAPSESAPYELIVVPKMFGTIKWYHLYRDNVVVSVSYNQ